MDHGSKQERDLTPEIAMVLPLTVSYKDYKELIIWEDRLLVITVSW